MIYIFISLLNNSISPLNIPYYHSMINLNIRGRGNKFPSKKKVSIVKVIYGDDLPDNKWENITYIFVFRLWSRIIETRQTIIRLQLTNRTNLRYEKNIRENQRIFS